eukprot:scaffold20425_cov70-Phaeocystis_antarctica.AAC.1
MSCRSSGMSSTLAKLTPCSNVSLTPCSLLHVRAGSTDRSGAAMCLRAHHTVPMSTRAAPAHLKSAQPSHSTSSVSIAECQPRCGRLHKLLQERARWGVRTREQHTWSREGAVDDRNEQDEQPDAQAARDVVDLRRGLRGDGRRGRRRRGHGVGRSDDGGGRSGGCRDGRSGGCHDGRHGGCG